jgi:hypothetical protein
VAAFIVAGVVLTSPICPVSPLGRGVAEGGLCGAVVSEEFLY